jgi:anaerobic selenocysteine-containing dehydrogenase
MAIQPETTRRVHGYCSLCIARCGCVATVENGRFTRLDPDPTHPTGRALCAKGRAAPELVYSKERLTKPLRRTRPKGDADPGWQEISWDLALDEIACAMKRIASTYGSEAVAFSLSSPSTTATGDSIPYVNRLMNAFGSPNFVWNLELCGWGRSFATRYAFGEAVVGSAVGGAMPDIANSGCLILWGYNPSISRLTHATATVDALKRGMKLIVVDPRNAGLANKADVWLRVRPGTDGALALGLANQMIERGWFDRDFIRDWSNGPFLVREDTGRLLRESDLAPNGDSKCYVAWCTKSGKPIAYDASLGRYEGSSEYLALTGEFDIPAAGGAIRCRSVFEHYAALCRRFTADVVEATCWIPRAHLEEAARLIWQSRPVSYYAWSGHEQHANATETARAMALLYALTGSFDAPGGNVMLPAVPSRPIMGKELPAAQRLAPSVGVASRPLGPARWGAVTARDFYAAVLDGVPYPVRGLIGFGSNMLLSQADPGRGREALAALDFYAHADLFMTPTAAMADIVLPVASCFEAEALKIGFEIDVAGQSLVQFRQAVVPPPGEARSDIEFIFGLADRLGFRKEFWDGNIDASYRDRLGPSGVTLEGLRAEPGGVRVELTTRHKKYAEVDKGGSAKGFATPSRKVEFWSETFQDHGYAALPDFIEPRNGPVANPDLASRYPLVLTCAKPTVFCQSQHRGLPSLRSKAHHPGIELHPDAAATRGVAEGCWVTVETPAGGMRARAHLNDKLDPRVVIGQHGWWQACCDLDMPGYDPFDAGGSNYNLTLDPTNCDPISGTPEHRANLCQVKLVQTTADARL